jgi:hypothetical protein
MSYDKFIQSRTIAKFDQIASGQANFPNFFLSSFINFETDGYLVGVHFMHAHNSDSVGAGSLDTFRPSGAMIAKVSGDAITLPAGGNTTNFSGAQILLCHLAMPSSDGASSLESDSRQTTISYDADSKRIPIKSDDKLGVYLCGNGSATAINFNYTLTAYFVRV